MGLGLLSLYSDRIIHNAPQVDAQLRAHLSDAISELVAQLT